jgi:hypothetical protein
MYSVIKSKILEKTNSCLLLNSLIIRDKRIWNIILIRIKVTLSKKNNDANKDNGANSLEVQCVLNTLGARTTKPESKLKPRVYNWILFSIHISTKHPSFLRLFPSFKILTTQWNTIYLLKLIQQSAASSSHLSS